MADPYQRLDTLEAIKAAVLAQAPQLARELERLREEPWRGMTVSEAQVEAVAVALGMDRLNPAERRRARTLARELEPPEPAAGTFAMAREDSPGDPSAALTGDRREALARTLGWIAADPPARWLAKAAGAHAAAAHVRRHAKALGGIKAWQWLAALGYPAVVPDGARQRVLVRLGWMEPAASTVAGREEAQRRMEALAHGLGTPAGEFGLLLGAFAGAGDMAGAAGAARCTPKPRCGECPAAGQCAWLRANRSALEAPTRNLVATTPEGQRPRERLASAGPDALSEAELLAIILRTGSGRHNAVDVAHEVLRRADGSIDRLAAMTLGELAAVPGMGHVKAVTVQAALALARRLQATNYQRQRVKLDTARKIRDFLRPQFIGRRKEEFHVLHVNAKLELIRPVRISEGILTQTLAHPREVFTEAIRDSAHGVILVHNHPSGDPNPSREDRRLTTMLVHAGDILGIRVVDHVIVGAETYYSFSDAGQLK